jgi:hypothetical protein
MTGGGVLHLNKPGGPRCQYVGQIISPAGRRKRVTCPNSPEAGGLYCGPCKLAAWARMGLGKQPAQAAIQTQAPQNRLPGVDLGHIEFWT